MSLLTNLIAHWKLNEASGSRSDSVGSNTLTDNGSVTSATGKIGDAASFVAASSQSLSHADNSDLQTGDIDFTYTCWVNLSDKSGHRVVLNKSWDQSYGEFLLFYSSSVDLFQAQMANGSAVVNASSIGSPSTSTWYFIVVWYDSAANTFNIQVNNGSVNSTSYSGGNTTTSGLFKIGLAFGAYFDGLIDSVSFWKRTLTSDERTQLYDFGIGVDYPFSSDITSNLEGWWKFDEGSGTTATDSSGNGHTGTNVNSPSYVVGKVGPYAINPDETGTKYVDIPFFSAINSSAITVGGWFYSLDVTSNTWLIHQWDSNSAAAGIALFTIADAVYFEIGGSFINTGHILTAGAWYHIIGVNDNGNLSIYINSSLSSGPTNESITQSTSNHLRISNDASDGGVGPFTGYADDIRFYSRALSPLDIEAIYNYTEPAGGGVISKIDSVAFANIGKVNGVAIGSVKKYNGVAAQ